MCVKAGQRKYAKDVVLPQSNYNHTRKKFISILLALNGRSQSQLQQKEETWVDIEQSSKCRGFLKSPSSF